MALGGNVPTLLGSPVHAAALMGLRVVEAVAYAAGAARASWVARRA